MGDRNSTHTRVQPVFSFLDERDPSGASWLSRLLELPVEGTRPTSHDVGPIRKAQWGEDEAQLPAPKALLRWLLEHPLENPPLNLGTSSAGTQHLRRRLFDRDPKALGEALAFIERRERPSKGWCVFEGATRPDVFIETDDFIVVIEGKRTEAAPTRHTRWMPGRDQMLRHMDCAFEIADGKPVYGMYIVEGAQDGDPDTREPAPVWMEAARSTLSDEVLQASLPHRTAEERTAIASGFLGVTTWQRVCTALEIPWTVVNGSGVSPVGSWRKAATMRFALVEQWCNLRRSDDVSRSIRKWLRAEPERREHQVRSVLMSVALDGVDLVVLPGWSLVGREPPEWLVELSQDRTIVVEMLAEQNTEDVTKGSSHYSFVLQCGRRLIGPEPQILGASEEVWASNAFTKKAYEAASRIASHRTFELDPGLDVLMMICGEINLAHERAGAHQLPEGMCVSAPLVVNPSHTWMSLPANQRQREFLSRNGLLLTTANTHPELSETKTRDWKAASWKSAEVYWRGARVGVGEEEPSVSEDGAVRAQRIWVPDGVAEYCTPVVLGTVRLDRLER